MTVLDVQRTRKIVMFARVRHQLVGALALVVLSSSANEALAGPLDFTGQFNLKGVNGLRGGSGGELTVYNLAGVGGVGSTNVSNASYEDKTRNVPDPFPAGTPIPNSFQTFCLEMTEEAVTSALNYFAIGTYAAAGGGGAVNGRDPISVGTAWLYSEFAKGTLNVPKMGAADPKFGDYFSGVAPSRSNEADQLQRAIWWLEQEAPGEEAKLAINPYFQAAVNYFRQVGDTEAQARARAMASSSEGYLGVYVLNNFKTQAALNQFVANRAAGTTSSMENIARADRGQDFLWYYNPPTQVPDGGATVALLGGAMVAIAALRRRLGV
jgi:hypothetical protein